MSNKSRSCAAHHNRPIDRLAGLVVCRQHADLAKTRLTELPDLHTELAEYLDSASRRGVNTRHGTSTPGLKLDDSAASARADIKITLGVWVSYMLSPRPFRTDENDTRPQTQPFTVHPDDDEPATLAAWISQRLAWMLADEQGGDFVNDLNAVHAAATSAFQPDKIINFTVGRCPEPDCHGTLIARLRGADDLLPSEVVCDVAPTDQETGEQIHRWPADRWSLLARKITRQDTA